MLKTMVFPNFVRTAVAAALGATPAYGATVGLVHVDAANIDTFYYYLAATPVFVYADGGRFTDEPLLTDQGEYNAGANALADGAALWAIGKPVGEKIDEVREAYRISADRVVAIDGDVFEVANKLALNWTAARAVVVAPYVPDGDARAAVSAVYAAKLASGLNAPLLFTYTGQTPSATTDALARVGAARVILIDIGGACAPEVVDALSGGGRNQARVITQTGDAASLLAEQGRLAGAALGINGI